MRWIGLTGGIASGKSTVAQILRNRGHVVIDADEISRQMTVPESPGLKSIVRYFGTGILAPNGELDRKKMGALVFSEPKKLAVLENVLHPLIQAEVRSRKEALQKEGRAVAFYDVPLLFEKKLEPNFDDILVVTTDLETQKKRLKARNNLSDTEVMQRIENQMKLSEKEVLAHFVIKNHGSIPDLEKQVDEFLEKLAAGRR